MKKKLMLATVIVLLLAIGLTLLVGCDEIFVRNDERDMTQVVARVHYKSETTDIYKYELRSSFASYAYVYINYYGMSAEAAANYILQSLAQQKLLVLYAREQVNILEHGTAAGDSIPKCADLLNEAELNKAIKDANDSLLSSLKSLVEDAVTEDNFNASTTTTTSPSEEDEDEDEEITDPVTVSFESYGGTEIENQRIQKNTNADEPDEPTKDGYTFYGWFTDSEYAKSEAFDDDHAAFDFEKDKVTERLTLHAKWVKYDAPRTALPEEEEEEEEFDPDAELKPEDVATPFFTWDADKLFEEIKEEDFVEKIELGKDEDLRSVLGEYIKDSLADLKKNLQSNLYKKSVDECWEYYINSQYDSLIVDKLERLIGKQVTVTDEEIAAEFQHVIDQNKESFALSESAYSSALTSSLSDTYFHPIDDAEHSYGFVTNILLRLDDDSLAELTAQLNRNPSNKKAVKVMRNIALSKMQVKISNPKYDADAVVEDENGDEIELRDPMTDPKNPYNNVNKAEYDQSYEFKTGEDTYANNYNKLLAFGKKVDEEGNETEEFEIKFQATEHPAMAYLLEKWPAFDENDKTGIIRQIYNSFKEVQDVCQANNLDKLTEVYWLRKMASTWAYLVGDDTGAVTSSSNNNGLGYLISPEGEDSSYLEDFTDYARNLIKKGTGSYCDGNVTDACFAGAAENSDGTLAGDKIAFVAADSFIDSGSTSNGYAGIFVLLNTYTVWDNDLYKSYSEKDLPDDQTLPDDYIFDITLDEEDRKTFREIIEEELKTAKQANLYNLSVNTMGSQYAEDIEYFAKAYKSIWKDYE